MKSTKKLFAILTLVMFMMTLVPMAAFGAAIAAPTFSQDGAEVATNVAASQDLVVFTPAAATAAGMKIKVTFPAGTTLTSGNIVAGDFTIQQVGGAATAPTAVNVSGTSIEFTVDAASVAGDTAAVTIATAAGAGANEIKWPTAATTSGTLTVEVDTAADGTYEDSGSKTNCTFVAAGANRFNSLVTQNKTVVDADMTDEVEFTIWAYDQYNNFVIDGTSIFVASNRGETDSFPGAADTVVTEVKTVTTTGGKATAKLRSAVAGAAKVGFALTNAAGTNNVYAHLMGVSDATADACKLIDIKDVTFQTSGASNLGVFEVHIRNRAAATWGAVALASGKYDAGTNNKADNLDHYRLRFRLTNSVGAPASNQTVDFTANSTYARLSTTSATTDANGIATVLVYATRGGNYKVTATSTGNTTAEATVVFAVGDAVDIKMVSADNRKIAKDTSPNFDFEVFDSSGNKISPPSGADLTGVTVEVIQKPSSVSLDNSSFTKRNDGTNNYLRVKLATGNFTTEGDYTIRVSLDNGKYVDTKFTIKQQGTITRLSVNYSNTILPLDTVSVSPTVKTYDADDVEKTIANNSGSLTWAASDVSKLQAAFAGAYFDSTTRQIKTTASDKYAGPVVITVTDTTKNLVATQTITVADKLASIVASDVPTTEVGKAATILVKAIDVKGNTVSIGDSAVVFENSSVTAKPAGAIVSIDAESAFAKNLKEKGVAKVDIVSNTAGKVEAVLIITVAGQSYAVPVSAEFGAPKAVIGAQKVSMFIGSTGFFSDGDIKTTDVAPFIQNDRTFVAIRPVADAFGAEIGWNDATQTVTLTRSDMTVTIVIGSSTITVVKDGVTSTVTADVPAFIKDDRTVLPFRAVGDAFGATVTWDAASQSVTYEQ